MMNQLLTLSHEMGTQLYDLLSYNHDRIRGAMIGVERYWFKAYVNKYFKGNEVAFQQSQLYDKSLKIDFDYRPDRWHEHCVAIGYQEYAKPIYFLVILRNSGDIGTSDLPNQLNGYPIIYEYWPPCFALSNEKDWIDKLVNANDLIKSVLHQTFDRQNPHLSIGRKDPNTAGTLGGLLRCPKSQKLYIVSCAHVLGDKDTIVFSPGPYEGQEIRRVGKVIFSQLSSISNLACNPHIFTYFIEDNIHEKKLDLAIAELDDNQDILRNFHPINSVEHIRNIDSMALHDEVIFYGKVSHKVEAQIRYLCIWDEIIINGIPRCFRDVFVLTPRQRQYVNVNICSPGDSGAWVISNLSGVLSWDGMLFAGDGSHVYCCFAEYIQQACCNVFPPHGLALINPLTPQEVLNIRPQSGLYK